METYAVTLRPKGSHTSRLTSQTIFGAVCWAINTLQLTDVAELLHDCQQSPQFVFSSAFPFLEGPQGLLRFLPKPALPLATMDQVHQLAAKSAGTETGLDFKRKVKNILASQVKPIKKATYVSLGLFSEICAGEWDSSSLVETLGDKVEHGSQAGGMLWLTKERKHLWGRTGVVETALKTADVQRNAIDRVTGTTAEGLLFHESQTFYQAQQAGLWFLVRANAEVWPWLEAAFRYLQDTGIGGKRTVGKGHFDFEVQSTSDLLPDVDEADSFINLSLYLPKFNQKKIEAEPLSYNLQVVRKKAENKFPGSEQMRVYTDGLRVFAEGSIFALPQKQAVFGRLASLTPVNGHPVYYNGLAFPVFTKLGGII